MNYSSTLRSNTYYQLTSIGRHFGFQVDHLENVVYTRIELLIKVTNWFYPQETAASWHLRRRILSIPKLGSPHYQSAPNQSWATFRLG